MLMNSVLVVFILITGTAAKPLKHWNEVANEAVQKGWVSIDDKGMASWGVEVEPPEDMDETSFDIDPSMKIWKSMKSEQSKQYQMAEDDLDELQHPSTDELLKAQNNEHALLDEQKNDNTDHIQFDEMKPGWDEMDHSEVLDRYLAPLVAGYNGEPAVQAAHSEPEHEDMYHADVDSEMVVMELEPEKKDDYPGRLHLEPEEDMDHIYHADVPEMIPYDTETEAGMFFIDRPQRKHTEPEEDFDDMYHLY